MLSTGLPELQDVNDLEYLRDALALGVSDEVAREKFTGLIYDALTTVTTQVIEFGKV